MLDQFILVFGKTPDLSLAEALAWASARKLKLSVVKSELDYAVVEGLSYEVAVKMICELGGLIKVAKVVYSGEKLKDEVKEFGDMVAAHIPDNQVTFGFSWHGDKKQFMSDKVQLRTAMEIKRSFKEQGRPVRYVRPKGDTLTSVQVAKNKLTGEQGVELLIVTSDAGWTIAITLAVQPFEEWSDRDYGRPGRDAKSGMLPPKLARMMVNLLGVQPKGTLLDPFCGSGTIITEAMEIGWTKFIATDQASRAIKDTEKNVKWIKENRNLSAEVATHAVAIESLKSVVPSGSVDAVVTEGFLGPALTKLAAPRQVEKNRELLTPIYRHLLHEIARVLKPNGRAVFTMPRWVDREGGEQPLLKLRKLLPPGLKVVKPLEGTEISTDKPLVYSRPGQFVVRELVILERKPRTPLSEIKL